MTRSRPETSVSRRTALAGVAAGGFGLTLGGRRVGAQEASPAPVPAAVAVERGVVYGEVDGKPLLLDVYRPPAREASRPAVVVIHGGAMMFGSCSDMSTAAGELATAGYVAFSIDYRLMAGSPPSNAWLAPFVDAQWAVRWVRANAAEYGVDPERVGAYGHSSGGHLAALLGTRDTRHGGKAPLDEFSSRVTCVVDLAGDADMALLFSQPAEQQMALDFLGGTPEEAPEAYRDASPLAWVDGDSAPFLLLQGTAGDPAVEHSRRLATALEAAGVEVIHASFPRVDHFGVTSWGLTGALTLAFLDRHLRPEA